MAYEDVNGIIIGDVEMRKHYAFFDLNGERLTRGEYFASDAEAVEWFKKEWPDSFKKGAEMRTWPA